MTARANLRVPRQIRTGSIAESAPGSELRCAVLASTGDEWVAADLASGALLRNEVEMPTGPGTADLGDRHPLEVVALLLGPAEDSPDPARPEAVSLAEPARGLGALSSGRARRLLRRLAAPERPRRPLLGTWGPSIAFQDLDGTMPSVVLVPVGADGIELLARADGDLGCSIAWAGARQLLPLADPHARSATADAPARRIRGAAVATALGFQPGYALVGLGAVRAGHAPKVVLSLLAR